MVICNAPLTCLSNAAHLSPTPYTFLTTSVPPSPCSILSPLSSSPGGCSMLSPLSSSPGGCSIPSSPTAFSYSSPVALSPVNMFGSSGIMIQPSSWKQSYGMEHVWLSEFNRLFSYYPQIWFILPVDHRPISNNSIYSFVDSAKVRFCCNKCGHGWTSMKGRVAFWFDLIPPYYSYGFVTFKLYGQQCDRCKTDRYEQAMWYPEEVIKVLTNLYNRIGQIYYGFQCPQIEKTRRSGKPRTPHNSDLCQACKDGVCSDRK